MLHSPKSVFPTPLEGRSYVLIIFFFFFLPFVLTLRLIIFFKVLYFDSFFLSTSPLTGNWILSIYPWPTLPPSTFLLDHRACIPYKMFADSIEANILDML